MLISLIFLFLYLGKIVLGKYINKCIKSVEKFNWEIRNDLIVCKCWEMSVY